MNNHLIFFVLLSWGKQVSFSLPGWCIPSLSEPSHVPLFLTEKKKSSSAKNEPLIRLQPKTELKILLTERDLSISDLQAACHGKSSNTFKHQICPIRNVICSVRDISISPLNWNQIWRWLKSNFFNAKH